MVTNPDEAGLVFSTLFFSTVQSNCQVVETRNKILEVINMLIRRVRVSLLKVEFNTSSYFYILVAILDEKTSNANCNSNLECLRTISILVQFPCRSTNG